MVSGTVVLSGMHLWPFINLELQSNISAQLNLTIVTTTDLILTLWQACTIEYDGEYCTGRGMNDDRCKYYKITQTGMHIYHAVIKSLAYSQTYY